MIVKIVVDKVVSRDRDDTHTANKKCIQHMKISKPHLILLIIGIILASLSYVSIRVSIINSNHDARQKELDLLQNSTQLNFSTPSEHKENMLRDIAGDEDTLDGIAIEEIAKQEFTRVRDEMLNTGEVAPGKYVFPNVIYGHVHIAKTGGTSLNGMLANRFERVCGNKGNSFNAYVTNKEEKHKTEIGQVAKSTDVRNSPKLNGFEDCDYVSMETNWKFWLKDERFHSIPRELHVPCRDPIDHLLSQCHFKGEYLKCDASSDEEFFRSIDDCVIDMNLRFDTALLDKCDVHCFDFNNQFTTYVEYMADKLQPRRLVSSPFERRYSDTPRNKTEECIWVSPKLMEKAEMYLLETFNYYQFCGSCIGSEKEIRMD